MKLAAFGLSLAVVLGVVALPTPVMGATTFVVNRIGDAPDLNLANARCDTSSNSGNQCTLRAAIQEANDTFGSDTINFNISGTGNKIITPGSPLPDITGSVSINGYSQSGTSANTLEIGNNAVLRIVLDGVNAGAEAIGLNVQTTKSAIRGLVIQRWSGAGISLAGGKNLISGNFIGTNAAGSLARGNGHGLIVEGIQQHIGGGAPADRNLISGNDTQAVELNEVSGLVFSGNYVGTNKAGTAELANGDSGLIFNGGTNNVVSLNVISGNDQEGVKLYDTTDSQILGNLIGTDATGTTELGNGQDGIGLINASGNVIGGTEASQRNTVSGNQFGIRLEHSDSNTLVGNRIGTRADGTGNLGNGFGSVSVSGIDNQIGGAPGAGNIIANSGNGAGVFISADGPSADNLIQGNTIAGHEGFGINVQADSTRIIANSIVANGDDGIQVGASNINPVGVRMSGNNIINNLGLAIDLRTAAGPTTGVTPNDPGDADSGPNRRQNFPVLTSATRQSNGLTTVSGSLNSTANTEFRIELYLAAPDPTGHGEPQAPFGAQTITTNGSGNRGFAFQLGGLAPGMQLTALAINESNDDTSELSQNVVVVQLP